MLVLVMPNTDLRICVWFTQLLNETQVSWNHRLKSQIFTKWCLILDGHFSFHCDYIGVEYTQGSKLHDGVRWNRIQISAAIQIFPPDLTKS